MAMDWFRSWHNAPTDPKWLLIGRKANVAPGMVSAVFWSLLDYSSQNNDRGSIEGFDVETYAGWAGWDEADVEAIIAAMRVKGIITKDNRLASWDKRQPKREDTTSTERVRRHRAAKSVTNALPNSDDDVTPSNAVKRNVTQSSDRLDKTRKDKKRESTNKLESSSTNGKSPDDDLIDPEVTEAISKWQAVFVGTPFEAVPPVDKFFRWLAFGGPDVLAHMIDQSKDKSNPTGYLYTTYDNWRKDGEVAPHIAKQVADKVAAAAPAVPVKYDVVWSDGTTEEIEVMTRG